MKNKLYLCNMHFIIKNELIFYVKRGDSSVNLDY